MSTEQVSSEPSSSKLRSVLQPSLALRRQFATLANQIRTWAIDCQNPVAIGIVGVRGGVGVSTVAFNLAHALAQSVHDNILLIEASGGRSFAIKSPLNGRDLRGVLQGEHDVCECFAQTDRENFLVLAAGFERERSVLDVAWDGLKPLIREQLVSFRFVIVDLPPMSEENACSLIALNLDGLVVMTDEPCAGSPRLTAFREELETGGVEFIGVVINKVKS